MTLESDADRLLFLSTDDFATTATIAGSPVLGIFDDEYGEVLDIEGTVPVFLCRTSDVAAVAHGTTVTINAVAYTARGKQPDGTGMTLVILEEPDA